MTDHWRPTLLVVDDEPGMLALAGRLARDAGFDVVTHANGREALQQLTAINADAALVDLQMPEIGGLDVLRAIRSAQPGCQVILMTAHASVETAIEAVKLGALDYLTKPFDLERLQGLFTTVRKGRERREALLQVESDVGKQFEFHGMIGPSPVMQELFDAIRRFAPHIRTALVTGETGTGKELVARALHTLGGRRDRRFVTINCSAVVETLFESELFGHVRGAFTGATDTKMGLFEAADGGTLFLDEIGELPLPLQAKLLRAVELGEVQRVGALEARKVDVRVVAATNRDLLDQSAAGKFRRLSIVEIRLPPLRERREDIPYLTAAFVRDCAARLNKPLAGVSVPAERLLQQAEWPGNIRELRNVIERACILSDGRILNDRELLAAMPRSPSATASSFSTSTAVAAPGAQPPAVSRHNRLRTVPREQIERTLKDAGGNKAEAARVLGVSRRALYRWLDRLDLTH